MDGFQWISILPGFHICQEEHHEMRAHRTKRAILLSEILRQIRVIVNSVYVLCVDPRIQERIQTRVVVRY
jgi:hypothetical protein